MKQLTLVGFYGPKPSNLGNLIGRIIAEIDRAEMKGHVVPYPIAQVHATLSGLEYVAGSKANYNANCWERTGEKRVMDFSCLLQTLENSLPLKIRIGGFTEGCGGFSSFGDTPFRRSFSLNQSTGKITLIGWPYTGDFQVFDFSKKRLLWEIRDRLATHCNIHHKYHAQEDNDLYMVLGSLNLPKGASPAEVVAWKQKGQQLENKVRAYLCRHPIDLNLDQGLLSVVQYEQEALALNSSKAWKVRELQAGGFSFQQLLD